MSKITTVVAVTAIAFLAFTAGCNLNDSSNNSQSIAAESSDKLPIYLEGTIGQYAILFGGGQMNLQGYGLVIALGTNGSSEVPGHLLEYYGKMFGRHNIGRYSYNTQNLTPKRILNDRDTAPVLLAATLPPGAPAGSTFDVFVNSFPQTQTRTLDGGYLMPVGMYVAWAGRATPGGPSFVWAKSSGSIFVDPFIDFGDPAAMMATRKGRVIGGLELLRDRPIRLQLIQGDYARCRQIETRLNEQFGGRKKIANATDSYTINLKVPPRWRDDYEHFLSLVLHTPLTLTGPRWERHLLDLIEELKLEQADHEQVAMVFEAVGRQLLPMLKPLYVSDNYKTAFYTARAGLRMGDYTAADVLLDFASDDKSPLQITAVEELGRHPKILRAKPVLRKLLDSPNALVQVAAYESLLSHGRFSHIKRLNISDQFDLDLVETNQDYVIYATQTEKPRIVLFGKDMIVSKPVFFTTADELLTIKAGPDDKKILAYRTVEGPAQFSETFKFDFSVATLVKVLGTRPEPDFNGKVHGLGLTYGQVVRALYGLCKEDIPAKFILQPTSEIVRMYREDFESGRGDMAE